MEARRVLSSLECVLRHPPEGALGHPNKFRPSCRIRIRPRSGLQLPEHWIWHGTSGSPGTATTSTWSTKALRSQGDHELARHHSAAPVQRIGDLAKLGRPGVVEKARAGVGGRSALAREGRQPSGRTFRAELVIAKLSAGGLAKSSQRRGRRDDEACRQPTRPARVTVYGPRRRRGCLAENESVDALERAKLVGLRDDGRRHAQPLDPRREVLAEQFGRPLRQRRDHRLRRRTPRPRACLTDSKASAPATWPSTGAPGALTEHPGRRLERPVRGLLRVGARG